MTATAARVQNVTSDLPLLSSVHASRRLNRDAEQVHADGATRECDEVQELATPKTSNDRGDMIQSPLLRKSLQSL